MCSTAAGSACEAHLIGWLWDVGPLGEGRARAHMAVRASRVLEPCQGARVDPATGWGGQVVETAWVVVWDLRGFHEGTGIHSRHRWRANFGVVRHEWRELA